MNMIKSALYNLSSKENTSNPHINEYCHGLVIGIVSAIMEEKKVKFDIAIEAMKSLLPDDIDKDRLPDAWRDLF